MLYASGVCLFRDLPRILFRQLSVRNRITPDNKERATSLFDSWLRPSSGGTHLRGTGWCRNGLRRLAGYFGAK